MDLFSISVLDTVACHFKHVTLLAHIADAFTWKHSSHIFIVKCMARNFMQFAS